VGSDVNQLLTQDSLTTYGVLSSIVFAGMTLYAQSGDDDQPVKPWFGLAFSLFVCVGAVFFLPWITTTAPNQKTGDESATVKDQPVAKSDDPNGKTTPKDQPTAKSEDPNEKPVPKDVPNSPLGELAGKLFVAVLNSFLVFVTAAGGNAALSRNAGVGGAGGDGAKKEPAAPELPVVEHDESEPRALEGGDEDDAHRPTPVPAHAPSQRAPLQRLNVRPWF
jgi:hypothetical protein